MSPFDQSYSSSEPVLMLQPQLPPDPSSAFPRASSSNPPSFSSPFGNGGNPQAASSMWPVSTSTTPAPIQSTPLSGAGRKRSRDEAASNLSDDEYIPIQAPMVPQPQPLPESEEAWEYGEGMTLIKPGSGGYIMEAASQTGTWAEERAAEEAAALPPAPPATTTTRQLSPERPILRASKSQRLDLTATPPIAEEFMQNGALTTPLSSSPERANGFTEPTIDDFTRHLGIGWSRINSEEDIQAAVRGWTRYIENHYPVTDAKIVLQSRGLASYLVEANEGYFLFGEDLKQARLVSTCLQKVWANLKGATPIFDGELVMEAGDTPKPNAGGDQQQQQYITMNTDDAHTGDMINGALNHDNNNSSQGLGYGMEIEMDMS